MGKSNRAVILGAPDMVTEPVRVEEWGCTVNVRTMGVQQFLEYVSHLSGAEDDTGQDRTTLLVACCVDDDGAPLFTYDDVPALAKKSGVAIARLYTAALRVNGMLSVEEHSKN